MQSWCQKHPTAEDSEADDTDNESKIDPSEVFWEALKSAPGRVILKRPAFIDLSMAVISEVYLSLFNAKNDILAPAKSRLSVEIAS